MKTRRVCDLIVEGIFLMEDVEDNEDSKSEKYFKNFLIP